MRALLGCWLLAALAPLSSGGELGRPLLQTFTTGAFTRIQLPSAPLQDADGRLYFGDFSSAVVFDGTAWAAVEMPFAKPVAPLARGPDGTLYAGGHLRVGFFRRGSEGNYAFVALEDRLRPEERDFGDVQVVAALKDGTICFAATRELLFWRDGRFTTLAHGEASSWIVDGTVYLLGGDGTLRRVDGGRLTDVSSHPLFGRTKISFLLGGRSPGTLLLGSLDQGLFVMDRGRVDPLATDVDARLRREHLVCGVRLADGSLALGLANGHVLLVDRDGRFETELGPADGLGNSAIRALGLDDEGGLWICQQQQLARAQWPAGFTFFDEKNGLPNAAVRDVLRQDGTLYAATVAGVYRLIAGFGGEAARFEPVPGTAGGMQAIESGPTGMVTATGTQLFELASDTLRPVLTFSEPSRTPAYVLRRSVHDPRRVWIGQAEGLRSVRWTGKRWVDEGRVPGFDRMVTEILDDQNGTVWIANYTDGFARFRFAAAGGDARGVPQIDTFFGGRGLPQKLAANNRVTVWDGAPLFEIDYGAYRLDPKRDRFVPFTDVGENLNRSPLVIARIVPTTADHFWLRAYTTPPGPGEMRGRRFFLVTRDGTWRQLPHYSNDAVGAGGGAMEEGPATGRVAWLPGSGGLGRVELARAFSEPNLRPAIVTVEASAAGETWSDEMPSLDATDPRVIANAPRAVPAQWIAAGARVPYARHDLRFHYFAPRFQLGAAPQYQTYLEGYDAGWTGWRADASRTVTNLMEGRYLLHVRAQDSDGRVTPETTFAFGVLPPWWRSWWALAGYAFAAAGVLAGTVRWRVAALHRRNAKLEETVAMRTSELQASEAELRVARDAADAANRAKSAFLANMSHELRTPLNAILGYTQIMQREPALPERNRARLDQMAQSGEHLLRLINDVLDLSKIEAGRIDVHPRPCALRKLVSGIGEFFQLRAAQKALGFNLLLPAPLPEWVQADEHRLRQVLSNLLGNALKFTERGRIELRVVVEGERIRFEVHDTGIGIAPEDRERIFAPFQQTMLPQLAAEGAGLGLAISQRLVRLMGGELHVESAAGQGSVFWFTVVLPEIAAPISTRGGDRVITGYHGARRRVLVVDDEPANRDVLHDMLTGVGFEVVTADGGESALAAGAAGKFDLILLDLRLPGIDGLTLAPRLRGAAGGPIAIVALSASVYPVDRERAIASGCDEFIAKPVHEQELLVAIGRLLRLEWVVAEGRSARRDSATPFELVPLPSVPALNELIALADCGDVLKLTEVLGAMRTADSLLTPFVDRVEALASSYQMRALSEALREARTLATRRFRDEKSTSPTAREVPFSGRRTGGSPALAPDEERP